jgi:hypothetical protein
LDEIGHAAWPFFQDQCARVASPPHDHTY